MLISEEKLKTRGNEKNIHNALKMRMLMIIEKAGCIVRWSGVVMGFSNQQT